MKENRIKIGYATGVFDLFHIGHLNLLQRAKTNCDFLVVGVTTDEEAYRVKKKKPFITYRERAKIVEELKCVDKVVPETSVDKLKAWESLHFNVIFKGDDWKGTAKWNKLEDEFDLLGVEVIYFPYTDSTSSTKIKEMINMKLL